MNPDYYRELLQNINCNKFMNPNKIYLTVKNYKSEKGVSMKFFENYKTKFNVKGPMGKGLGITANSSGTHMAFTAGTGILVFIDLIVKIA